VFSNLFDQEYVALVDFSQNSLKQAVDLSSSFLGTARHLEPLSA
jgi:hypothetical protein